MKIRLVVPLLGMAIGFAVPTFAQQTNTPDPQLRQQLIAAIQKHADAMNSNDAAAAAACFTEDGVYVTDRGPINGRKLLRSGMQISSRNCISAIMSSPSTRIRLTAWVRIANRCGQPEHGVLPLRERTSDLHKSKDTGR
jgi:hypothetical protein